MIKAVIIDVDDTLCLTEAICFELENEVLTEIGATPQSREIHKQTWGKPLFEIITTRSPGVDADTFRQLYEQKLEGYVRDGKLDAIPQANFLALDSLLAAGKQLYILTSRTLSEAKHLLEPDHFLASRISGFYHKENTTHHKPDPRVFDVLLQEHSLQADECVYIGDSPSDAEAAINAGLHFVASLESQLRTRENFAAYTVAAFINTFPEVVGAVEALEAK